MTDYGLFINAPSQADPTRTLTLRSKWVADWNRRIAALKRAVLKSVVENDCFGLREPDRLIPAQALEPVPKRQWAYRWSHEKVQEFMSWLNDMESRTLLEITKQSTLRPGGEPWSNIYVRSAYQRGLQFAMDNVRKNSSGQLARLLGMTEADFPPSFKPTGGAISAVMQQPFHADRLALAYTRVYDELKGVTAEMDKQISQILTRGIAEGQNPRDIGDLLADRIEKIGGTRGRLIARTETIHVHQQAALNEYYATEQATGEVFLVEWKATLDARVRDTHEARNRRVYTKEESYRLIGEPNCRCALLPFIPAVQGMPEKASPAAKAAAEQAVAKPEAVVEEKKAAEKEVSVGPRDINHISSISKDISL